MAEENITTDNVGTEQTGTPAPTPTPVPSVDVNALVKRLDELELNNKGLSEQVKESHKKITEISTEKATLERRYAEIGRTSKPMPEIPPYDETELAEIQALAETDPTAATKRFINATKKSMLALKKEVKAEAMEETEKIVDTKNRRSMWLNDFLSKHPDAKDNDVELGALAGQKMSMGIPYEDAVTQAYEEHTKKMEEYVKARIPKNTETPKVDPPKPAPAPSGALGEGGTNTPPSAPVKSEPEETTSDWIRRREEARLRKMGIKLS